MSELIKKMNIWKHLIDNINFKNDVCDCPKLQNRFYKGLGIQQKNKQGRT